MHEHTAGHGRQDKESKLVKVFHIRNLTKNDWWPKPTSYCMCYIRLMMRGWSYNGEVVGSMAILDELCIHRCKLQSCLDWSNHAQLAVCAFDQVTNGAFRVVS